MATIVTKGDAREASGRTAVGAKVQRPAARINGGRLTVVFLVLLLVGLEVLIFQLSRSKGSPSWQAGWAAGVHLGKAAYRTDGHRTPATPPAKACHPTPSQLAKGIKTRTVEVAAREVDAGDFQVACIAGYQVTLSRLKG